MADLSDEERMAHSSSDQLTQEEWNLVIEILKKEDFIKVPSVFNFTNEEEIKHIKTQCGELYKELGEYLTECDYHKFEWKIHESDQASYVIGSFKYDSKDLSKSQVKKIIKLIKVKKDENLNLKKYELLIKKIKKAFDWQDCQGEEPNADGPSTNLETSCPDNRQNTDVNGSVKITTDFAMKHVLGADEEPFNDHPVLSKKLSRIRKETMKMLIESQKKIEEGLAFFNQRFDFLVIAEKNGVIDVRYFKGTKVRVLVKILPDNTIYHFHGFGQKNEGKNNTFIMPPQNQIEESNSENEQPSSVSTNTAGMAPKNLEEPKEEEGLAVRGEHKESAEMLERDEDDEDDDDDDD